VDHGDTVIRTALLLVVASSTAALADDKPSVPQLLREAPATGAPLPVPATDVMLEATSADKRLTGRFGIVWADKLFGDIKLSAPVSDSGDPVTAATIDGLSAGTSAELSLAIVQWNPRPDEAAQRRICIAALSRQRDVARGEAEQKLKQYKPPMFVCSATGIPPEIEEEFAKRDAAGREQLCIDYRNKTEVAEKAALNKQIEELKKTDWVPDDSKPLVCPAEVWNDPGTRQQFIDATNFGTPFIAGIRLKLDEKTFKYYDPTTYDSKKRKGINVSGGAYFGVIVDGWGTFSVLFRVERSYTEGTKSTVCLPGTVTGSLLCNDLAKGAPKASTKTISAISFQRTVLRHLGVVGRAGFEGGNTLILELPLYFIQPKGGSFTGGVVFSASKKLQDDPMMMPEDDEWSTTALVFLGGRFDALGVNTTWK
jgi:hypothetical protein